MFEGGFADRYHLNSFTPKQRINNWLHADQRHVFFSMQFKIPERRNGLLGGLIYY